jgi:hypothetical protein
MIPSGLLWLLPLGTSAMLQLRLSWYWPMFTFTVTTKVPNEQPEFHILCPLPLWSRPSHLFLFLLATYVWLWQVLGVASAHCSLVVHCSEPQRSQGTDPGQWALFLLDSKVVSSPALITDERWIVLSRENARMPWSRQSSVRWVESISFKFRIPYICGLDDKEKRSQLFSNLTLSVKHSTFSMKL